LQWGLSDTAKKVDNLFLKKFFEIQPRNKHSLRGGPEKRVEVGNGAKERGFSGGGVGGSSRKKKRAVGHKVMGQAPIVSKGWF